MGAGGWEPGARLLLSVSFPLPFPGKIQQVVGPLCWGHCVAYRVVSVCVGKDGCLHYHVNPGKVLGWGWVDGRLGWP